MAVEEKVIQNKSWFQTVCYNLDQMRQTETLCDVVIIGKDGTQFLAHSAILGAASEYLQSLLTKARRETFIMKTEIADTTWSQILEFVYKSQSAIPDFELPGLQEIAEQLQMNDLVSACEDVDQATPLLIKPDCDIAPEEILDDTPVDEQGSQQEHAMEDTIDLLLPDDSMADSLADENHKEQMGQHEQVTLTDELTGNEVRLTVTEAGLELEQTKDADDNTYQPDIVLFEDVENPKRSTRSTKTSPRKKIKVEKESDEDSDEDYEEEEEGSTPKKKALQTGKKKVRPPIAGRFTERIVKYEVATETMEMGQQTDLLEDEDQDVVIVKKEPKTPKVKNEKRVKKPQSEAKLEAAARTIIPCGICCIKFRTIEGAERHRRKKHFGDKSGGPPYACSLCAQVFHSRTNLFSHEMKHKGQRPFDCERCGAKYQHSSSLREHYKSCGGVTLDGQRIIKSAYLCQTCGQSFSSQKGHKMHQLRHTNEKPFKCSMCDKTFRKASNCRLHERVHQGFRPHKCPHCTKAFTDSTNLKRHIRLHTGEKPYRCDVCNQAFAQSGSLKHHLKKHHPEISDTYQQILTIAPSTMNFIAGEDGQEHIVEELHIEVQPQHIEVQAQPSEVEIGSHSEVMPLSQHEEYIAQSVLKQFLPEGLADSAQVVGVLVANQ